ncbi:cupin domain-containing protein [Novosphingobium sp.]|uniref:cupin domain-containing protein n=1 Tax=Novosphingobium sp. TaxID=1874826 RepID=UPI0025E972D6|nr:cupin domain-containing protein [Novosphingobium sp.]
MAISYTFPVRHLVKAALLAAAGLTGTASLIGVPALATPGSGFAPAPLAVGSLPETLAKADKAGHWDVTLKTKDVTTVGVDNLTVQPGGYSGWHTHTGLTVVTVTGGQINWVDAACQSKTYQVGDTFIEPANSVHYVRNPYGNTATLVAVQLRPLGTGGRIDAAAPAGCSV